MATKSNNQADRTKEIDDYRSRTKYVALGFVAILALIIFIMVLWSKNANVHSRYLNSMGEHHSQAQLLANMLYAVQKRSLNLYQMLDIRDPFEQDDQYLLFRQHGEMYLKNREKLLATGLTELEREILRESDKLANFGGFTQERVVNLIIQGDINTARYMLNNDIMPNQNVLIDKLRNIFESQRDTVNTELQSATVKHKTTYWLIYFLGSIGFLLGVFTIFVVKRTAKSETELFDQSQWIRSLYEISSMSGLSPDEQIAETLKRWISKGEFTIGEPQFTLPN